MKTSGEAGADVRLARRDFPELDRHSSFSPPARIEHECLAPGTGAAPHEALRLEGRGWTLEYLPDDGYRALRGRVRIELTGDAASMNKALQRVVGKAGLQQAFAPPTAGSLQRYARVRLLWRVDPAALKALVAREGELSSIALEDLEDALRKAGVRQTQIDGLRYEAVAPGHFTVVDDATAAAMKKAGLRYAYSTVTDPEHVLSILRHGQKSSLTRWDEGALIAGLSSKTDLATGGATGVFSRLVVPESEGKRWTGRNFKIILKPELLGRLDIWGWDSDQFGRGWDLGPENFGVPLVKAVRKREKTHRDFATDNEIVSPVGNGPEWIACVVATNVFNRERLIDYRVKAHFEPPGGQSLEAFVRLEPNVRADLLG